jgi:hypothetical protein
MRSSLNFTNNILVFLILDVPSIEGDKSVAILALDFIALILVTRQVKYSFFFKLLN